MAQTWSAGDYIAPICGLNSHLITLYEPIETVTEIKKVLNHLPDYLALYSEFVRFGVNIMYNSIGHTGLSTLPSFYYQTVNNYPMFLIVTVSGVEEIPAAEPSSDEELTDERQAASEVQHEDIIPGTSTSPGKYIAKK